MSRNIQVPHGTAITSESLQTVLADEQEARKLLILVKSSQPGEVLGFRVRTHGIKKANACHKKKYRR